MLLAAVVVVVSLAGAAGASREAVLVTGGNINGAETQEDFRSCELLLGPCPVAALPRPSYEHATIAMADGTVLSCSRQLGLHCHRLEPDLASWTLHSDLPGSFDTNTRALGAALPSGALLVARNTAAFLPTGATSWRTVAIPADHDARQACLVRSSTTSVLLIGGSWEQGDFIDEYEALTGEWTRWRERLPEKREGAACVKVGGQVLLVGGYNRAENEYDGATVILELAGRTFREGGQLSWGRHGHGAAALSSGRVLVWGGGYEGDSGAEEWSVETETWSPLEEGMQLARKSFGSAVIDVNC
jgi:hypothetical protein